MGLAFLVPRNRGGAVGKSLSRSFLNKGLRLIHLLLDLCCKVNINPKGNSNSGSGTELIWALGSPGQTERHQVFCKPRLLMPRGCRSRCQPGGASRTSPPTSPLPCPTRCSVSPAGSLLATAPVPRCILGGKSTRSTPNKPLPVAASCWGFLAAPTAVVVMETLTDFSFLLKRCGGHMTMIVWASSLRAEMTTVVIAAGSPEWGGDPEELSHLAVGEMDKLSGRSSQLRGCISLF